MVVSYTDAGNGKRFFAGIDKNFYNSGIIFPFVRIKDGESTFDAAFRGFVEETGLNCVAEVRSPFTEIVGKTKFTIFHGKIAITSEEKFLKASHEGSPGWYTAEQMPEGPYRAFNLKAFRHFELF